MAEGRYRFERLALGEYLIQAFASSAQLASEPRAVTLGPGKSETIDLRLRLTARTDRIVVTATAAPETMVEAGKAMDTLDRASLDARNEILVGEALRLVPGLRVQQLGGPGSFTRIQMRGLRAADTGILIDGMRIRDAAAVQGDATAYLGDLQLVDAERIEVLRGLGSAVYGSNATAGVVNIVTDQGGGPLRGEIAGEGGGLGLGRGSARIGGGALNDRLNYSAGAAHLNVNGGIDGIENVRELLRAGLPAVAPNSVVIAVRPALQRFQHHRRELHPAGWARGKPAAERDNSGHRSPSRPNAFGRPRQALLMGQRHVRPELL